MVIVMVIVVVVLLVRGISSLAQTPLLSFRLVCKVADVESPCPRLTS